MAPDEYVYRNLHTKAHIITNANKTRYLHERLNSNTFLSVLCSVGGVDSVHSEPWLEMTGGGVLLAVADIGQQEQLP